MYLEFHGNLFLLKDMQDLVLQYLKKTVLRPRAVGKSEFLGGQVCSSMPFEGKGFAFIPGILSGGGGSIAPLPPIPTAL